jgi:Icc protein
VTEHKAQPFRLVQITDCHLGGEPGEVLLGMDTDESFVDVLELVQAREANCDYIVASGDIASFGSEQAYYRFLDFMKEYTQQPLAWLPGNHDLASLMQVIEDKSGDGEYSVQGGVVDTDAWRIILLDSSVVGSEGGALAAAEIERLQRLITDTDKHILIFVHHQPIPVGSAWIDQYVIENNLELFSVLRASKQVKAIVNGHIHQEFNSEKEGIAIMATPSTCIQFAANSREFKVDTLMPGYRWFNLYDDGDIETGVERVAQKDYGIDFGSGGY